MVRVLSCLVYEHNYSFVIVAAIVCVMSSVMTVRLFDRAERLAPDLRFSWIVLSGMAGGAAIWTTHFVAMLGFHIPMNHAFNPFLTLVSLLIAITLTAGGLFLAAEGIKHIPAELGGVVIGLGIVAMHFTGMAGLETPAYIEWDSSLVVASVLFAVGFGALTTHLLARHKGGLSRPVAMMTLVLAICTMHFTAMGAATLVPDPSIQTPAHAMSKELLAVLALATMAVIAGLAIYIMDARSQRELVDSFRHAAMHDPLTGLPNRAYLSEYLPGVLEDSLRKGTGVAVLVIDLDRFKEINDVHGHNAGDLLLQTLASRFKHRLQQDETICRVGGDEFVAIKQQVKARSDADGFARKLLGCIREPLQLGLNTLSVGASIGICQYPDHSRDADDLIGRGDLAMYRAKRSIGEKVCYYEPSMDEGRRERSVLAMELRHAVERGELEIYFSRRWT